MSYKISMDKAKKIISLPWFIISGLLFTVIFFQSLIGFYGEKVNDVWSWFLPTVLPTLSLIISVIVSDAITVEKELKKVNYFVFIISLIVSIFYLLSISVVILGGPIFGFTLLGIMKVSNFGLSPLLGVVTLCLGVFFIKKEK
jgi:hypothetical protein